MIKILMAMYGRTSSSPAPGGAVRSDCRHCSSVRLAGQQRCIGRCRPLDGPDAPGGAGCCIQGLMRRLATLTLLCAPSATSGAIPSIAPRMEQS